MGEGGEGIRRRVPLVGPAIGPADNTGGRRAAPSLRAMPDGYSALSSAVCSTATPFFFGRSRT